MVCLVSLLLIFLSQNDLSIVRNSIKGMETTFSWAGGRKGFLLSLMKAASGTYYSREQRGIRCQAGYSIRLGIGHLSFPSALLSTVRLFVLPKQELC